MAGAMELAVAGNVSGKTLVLAGTPLASPDAEKAGAKFDQMTLAFGENPGTGAANAAPGWLQVVPESVKATYRLAGLVTPVATPTDLIQIQGSSTKLIRVVRFTITLGNYTAGGTADFLLIRRSTASSGGTSSSPTIGKSATADANPTAVVLVWTVNPASLGTAVHNLGAKKAALLTSGAIPPVEWRPGSENDKAIVLNGTSDFLNLNLNADTLITGESLAYDIVWTEETP